MQQSVVDYAVPRGDSPRRGQRTFTVLAVFVSVVAAIEILLVWFGTDAPPSSWNDFYVLVLLNPLANLIAGAVFLGAALPLRRRFGGSALLYMLGAVVLPLVGALIVYHLVKTRFK